MDSEPLPTLLLKQKIGETKDTAAEILDCRRRPVKEHPAQGGRRVIGRGIGKDQNWFLAGGEADPPRNRGRHVLT